ncbi:MAG: hypothetical protein K0S34_654 [Bacillales bacterium]|jgi:hypothetical protein|nr:hypothetical protein [Bacillales bacterium]
MIQRFIELGNGYSDLYELIEICIRNEDRLANLVELKTCINGTTLLSFIVILTPTATGNFQPMYLCREGITLIDNKESKRRRLFYELAEKNNKMVISLETKNSMEFVDKELFYAYLTGIFRMNRIIPGI